ncbi:MULTISPECIES: hypothetical protein [unclassified Roseitalea]|uniref:hypothetical protein n=1 Tax=unclassified Roseitalea TaxID=2639107 RepID=UPI00273CFCE8|nr:MULTISPECIES: hypothetical protein [unclassified Roseitalea]
MSRHVGPRGAAVAALLVLAALLSGCTGFGGRGQDSQVEDTLDLGADAGTPVAIDADGAAGAMTAPADNPAGATAQLPADGAMRVHFAPIVGAPVDKITALSRRLSTAGPAANIRIEPSRAAGINHEIRGYFSALSENGATTVIHVWDVFNPQGQRVHRIQGQARVAGASGDPWASVPAATMEQIADTVLSEYRAWRGQSA